jgi:hypothetical protein
LPNLLIFKITLFGKKTIKITAISYRKKNNSTWIGSNSVNVGNLGSPDFFSVIARSN